MKRMFLNQATLPLVLALVLSGSMSAQDKPYMQNLPYYVENLEIFDAYRAYPSGYERTIVINLLR